MMHIYEETSRISMSNTVTAVSRYRVTFDPFSRRLPPKVRDLKLCTRKQFVSLVREA